MQANNPPCTAVRLGVLLLLSVNMWVFLNYIGPREKAAAEGQTEFHPTQGDLYSPWRGSQELILRHRDPYSPEVSRDLQLGYYGRILSDAPGDEKDQQRFAYPVYVSFFLAPFVQLDFATIRIIFFWLLLVVTVASLPLWLRLVQARISRFQLIGLVALTVSSVPVVQGLNFQQLALLAAALLAACAALLVSGRYFLSGVALALASIKPQMSVFITIWLTLWVVADWRKRKSLLWGFAITLAVLVLAGQWISPGWIPKFIDGLFAYQQYTGGGNTLTMTLPKPLAIAAAAVLAGTVGMAAWRSRQTASDSTGFAFTFVLMLVFTVLFAPAMRAVFNQILVLPALLLAWSRWRDLSQRDLLSRPPAIVLAAVVISPWVLGTVGVLLRLLHPQMLQRFWLVPLYPNVLLPFFAFAGLCFLFKNVPGIGKRGALEPKGGLPTL